ncbi:MAG TPA: DUF2946 family protein [Micropepsaceae bacterium]|nr:DUF2946 family protein [Micropepsaceae bacterium]
MRRRSACGFSRSAGVHRASISHGLLAVLALLALTFQAFFVQTHIHIPQNAGRLSLTRDIGGGASVSNGAGQTAADKAAVPRGKAPIGDDSSNCPVCQQLAHSGSFVQNAAVGALLSDRIGVSIFFWTRAALPSFAITHSWKSRAPPRV